MLLNLVDAVVWFWYVSMAYVHLDCCLTHKCGTVCRSVLYVHALIIVVCGYGIMDIQLPKHRCFSYAVGEEVLRWLVGPIVTIDLVMAQRISCCIRF